MTILTIYNLGVHMTQCVKVLLTDVNRTMLNIEH